MNCTVFVCTILVKNITLSADENLIEQARQAAAEHAGCALLYSGDLQHGQQFGGVAVKDPFR